MRLSLLGPRHPIPFPRHPLSPTQPPSSVTLRLPAPLYPFQKLVISRIQNKCVTDGGTDWQTEWRTDHLIDVCEDASKKEGMSQGRVFVIMARRFSMGKNVEIDELDALTWAFEQVCERASSAERANEWASKWASGLERNASISQSFNPLWLCSGSSESNEDVSRLSELSPDVGNQISTSKLKRLLAFVSGIIHFHLRDETYALMICT